MKMKVSDIIASYNSLSVLCAQKMPAKVSYQFALAFGSVFAVYKAYEKTNNEKVKEYGGNEEKGVPEKNLKAFKAEMESVQSTETDLTCSAELKIEDFVDREGKPIDIEPIHFVALSWLIK